MMHRHCACSDHTLLAAPNKALAHSIVYRTGLEKPTAAFVQCKTRLQEKLPPSQQSQFTKPHNVMQHETY